MKIADSFRDHLNWERIGTRLADSSQTSNFTTVRFVCSHSVAKPVHLLCNVIMNTWQRKAFNCADSACTGKFASVTRPLYQFFGVGPGDKANYEAHKHTRFQGTHPYWWLGENFQDISVFSCKLFKIVCILSCDEISVPGQPAADKHWVML